MIIYDLICDRDHTFEGWFQDRTSFEEQKETGRIECPVCGSFSVEMVPSSITIGGRKSKPAENAETTISAASTLKMLHDFIDRHFDNVGDKFAEIAIKIHRGEEPQRNIKGYTTSEQQETLEEEGIDFFRIPPPPKLDS